MIWPQQECRAIHGKDKMEVMVDLYVAGWQMLQHFQSTNNGLLGQGARVNTSRGFTQDLADRYSTHFETTIATQMLSMAKKMACSTLSTYVLVFHGLNTRKSLLTKHECYIVLAGLCKGSRNQSTVKNNG